MSERGWQTIEVLFASALEQPTAQRAAYVRGASPNPAVESEVLSLLQAHERRGRLDSLTDQLRGLSAATASLSGPVLAARLARGLAGRYRIGHEIGRGGMAIVFLVDDLKHNRQVALKMLQPGLAQSIGASRFLQEISIAAQLAHPHILPLHDSGEADGLLYYVMPYVEGESLRDRLRRDHRVPLHEALAITREVADALSHAHARGVVHRDIKPENVLLQAGYAVVSDFGIAWAMTAAGGAELSEAGVILGTPAYMSPEQATGTQPVDARSDLYSLGCLLFEMLAGQPPFPDSSAEAILARKTAHPAPSLRALQPTIPEAVARVVARALATAPADRYATAAALALDLARAAAMVESTGAPAGSPPHAPSGRSVRFVLSGVGVITLAAVVGLWQHLRPPRATPTTRYPLVLPAEQAPLDHTPVAISPDGARIAYVGPAGRDSRLWIKARDRVDVSPLPGTDGVLLCTFSPDGQWVAYAQSALLKKQPVDGGPAVTLADSASVYGVAWLDDGTIVYLRYGGRELWRIPALGGPAQAVWQVDSGNIMHPTPLPRGRGVLFVRWCVACGRAMDLWALDLGNGAAHLVQRDVVLGFYVPTGHIVFARPNGELLAVPFDLHTLRERGPPRRMRDSVDIEPAWWSNFALSQEGTLVRRAANNAAPPRRYRLEWVDRAGHETPIDSAWTFRHTELGDNAGWSLSPDGSRLAIGLASESGDDIWVKRLPNGPARRVTFDSAAEYRPRWTPDGHSLLFSSWPGGLYRRAADGTGTSTPIIKGMVQGAIIHEAAMTRDGRWLIARVGGGANQAGGRDIYAMRLGVDSGLRPLLATPADESEIALSPDGRWLAYVSNETGTPQVYVRSFPNLGTRSYQVSTGGGVAPLWAHNGRELFFVNENREMIIVTLQPGPPLRLGPSHTLFRMSPDVYLGRREFYTPYDISPDDQRFIMARRADPGVGDEKPLLITEGWFTDLSP